MAALARTIESVGYKSRVLIRKGANAFSIPLHYVDADTQDAQFHPEHIVEEDVDQMSLNYHRSTSFNNPTTHFEFTEENYVKVNKVLDKFPRNYKRSGILPLLDLAQRQAGWVPLAAMDKIALLCDVHPQKVYEAATFYTMFHRSPVGKYHLQVCTTTPCMLRNAYGILKAFETELGIHSGETTPDSMFSIGQVECQGACVNAPIVALDDIYYEDFTPETAVQFIRDIKAGKKITPGPQTPDRRSCEPVGEPTSLTEAPGGPSAPNLD